VLVTSQTSKFRRNRVAALELSGAVADICVTNESYINVASTRLRVSRASISVRMSVDLDLQLPSLEGATGWLNRTAKSVDALRRELKGRPTLVHFWSFNSESSKLNLAYIAELRDHRKREGLRVIAVNVPTTKAETETRAVGEAVSRLNITEPCALDNDRKLCAAFQNEQEAVPAYYLFDHDGKLLYFSTGAGGLVELEDSLDQLLSDLRRKYPFCPECEFFLNEEAMYCSDCGIPLILPTSQGKHPYYEKHNSASLPTVRLENPDPLIGRVIDGKYKLIACLGEGGMSIVYRARRVHIGDEVAVKILLQKFVADDAARARFRREARAAAMLHHPNIITIHDFGETGDDDAPAFIVMEFVRGTQLRELLKSGERFSVERAVRLMRGVCSGVGSAHRQGVVHRDLKPENILVLPPDEDYEFESVRVVDFGLAKLLDRSDAAVTSGEHKVTVVGTPFYMSPEQCLGEPADAQSDVYSLGAMLYEMIAGKRPFEADTVSGVINKQLYEAPPEFPGSLGVPRKISNAIMQALSKDPAARPQSASEFGRLLQVTGTP
jgi:tRNA A-37 threonylcarbamoyl transferase component Bud32